MRYELVIQGPTVRRVMTVTAACVPSLGGEIWVDGKECVVVKRIEQFLNVRQPKCTSAVAKVVVTAW